MKVQVKRHRKKTTIKVGNQSITMIDPAKAQDEEIARFLFPEMTEAIDRIMKPIYTEGREKWPRPGQDANGRSTGRSYSEFRYDVFVSGKGVLTARIANPAVNPRDGYAYPYSVGYQGGRGKTYWSRDFTKPFRRSKKKTLKDLTATYRRILERANG